MSKSDHEQILCSGNNITTMSYIPQWMSDYNYTTQQWQAKGKQLHPLTQQIIAEMCWCSSDLGIRVIMTAVMADAKNNHVNSQSAFTFNASVSELLTNSTMEQHLSICSISTNHEQILCSGYNITLIKHVVSEFTAATQYSACNKYKQAQLTQREARDSLGI